MMANAETCFIPLTWLGGTILAYQKLGAKLRELAILMLAKIEGRNVFKAKLAGIHNRFSAPSTPNEIFLAGSCALTCW
jgi:hypothetical protein